MPLVQIVDKEEKLLHIKPNQEDEVPPWCLLWTGAWKGVVLHHVDGSRAPRTHIKRSVLSYHIFRMFNSLKGLRCRNPVPYRVLRHVSKCKPSRESAMNSPALQKIIIAVISAHWLDVFLSAKIKEDAECRSHLAKLLPVYSFMNDRRLGRFFPTRIFSTHWKMKQAPRGHNLTAKRNR